MNPRTQKGLDYLREFQAQAKDAYVAGAGGQCAGGSRRAEPEGQLDQSSPAACWTGWPAWPIREGDGSYWTAAWPPYGRRGQIRQHRNHRPGRPGLAALRHPPDLANAALALPGARQKDSFGTWYSTQATVLSLKALLQAVCAPAVRRQRHGHQSR